MTELEVSIFVMYKSKLKNKIIFFLYLCFKNMFSKVILTLHIVIYNLCSLGIAAEAIVCCFPEYP